VEMVQLKYHLLRLKFRLIMAREVNEGVIVSSPPNNKK
jgi:hypothetical protein